MSTRGPSGGEVVNIYFIAVQLAISIDLYGRLLEPKGTHEGWWKVTYTDHLIVVLLYYTSAAKSCDFLA